MLKSGGGFSWSSSVMRADLAETDYCVARSMWRRLTMILPRMLVLAAAVCCSPVWGEDAPDSGDAFPGITISQLTALSEQDNAVAQYQLAKCYENGRGTERDDTRAVYWLTKSADLGNMNAQLHMFMRHHEGQGVIKDIPLSIAWLRRAALQGSTWAQTNLGIILHRGEVVKADQESAVVWFMLAAERGDTLAQIRLARCYAEGSGLQKSQIYAAKWYYVVQLARERKVGEQKANPQNKPLEVPFAEDAVEDSGIAPSEYGFAPASIAGKGLFFTKIAKDITQLEKQMTEKDILAAKAMALAWFTR